MSYYLPLESSQWKSDCHQCPIEWGHYIESDFVRHSDSQHATDTGLFDCAQYALARLDRMRCTAYGEMEVMGSVLRGND